MFGPKHVTSLLPLRVPHWRLNRVMEMLRHRSQRSRLRWHDDHPIRAYRRLLLNLLAAADKPEEFTLIQTERPALYEAHGYHYSPAFRQRQLIEACLLTRQSHQEIASKLGADSKAIGYYAALFFDVGDALGHDDWISLTIRGRARYDEESGASRAEAESGYILRLLGYHGGPLVLDSLITPRSGTAPPENMTQVQTWCEEAVTQNIRVLGTAASAMLEPDKNKMQLIRLGLRISRRRKSELRSGNSTASDQIDKILTAFRKAGLT